jgi:hypothetical protein
VSSPSHRSENASATRLEVARGAEPNRVEQRRKRVDARLNRVRFSRRIDPHAADDRVAEQLGEQRGARCGAGGVRARDERDGRGASGAQERGRVG